MEEESLEVLENSLEVMMRSVWERSAKAMNSGDD